MLVAYDDVAPLLGVGPSDANLTRLVAAANAGAKKTAHREFEFADHVEYLNGYGSPMAFVRETPIVQLLEVRIDRNGKFPDSTIIPDLTSFAFDPDPFNDDPKIKYLNGNFPEGVHTVRIHCTAGYQAGQLPQDLTSGLISAITAEYRRGIDQRRSAFRIGDYSASLIDESFDDAIAKAVKRYRR